MSDDMVRLSDVKLPNKLGSMIYKDFTWGNNPRECAYSCDRTFVKHKYPEINGMDIEDMNVDASVISGSGEFSGKDAYVQWNKLLATYKSHGPGKFHHPVYTDVSMALMTKLASTMEPRDEYVAYTFEFVAYNPPSISVSPITKTGGSSSSTSSSSSSGNIVIGSTVICNGYAYYTSAGANPHTALLVNKRMTVTHLNWGASHPICVGCYGWMRSSDVKLASGGSSSKSSNNITYVVKSGDCLSTICSRYGVDWHDVASYNHLKNPSLIYPGQKITIKR